MQEVDGAIFGSTDKAAVAALDSFRQNSRKIIVLEDFFGCTVMTSPKSRDEGGWPDHVLALAERQHSEPDDDERGIHGCRATLLIARVLCKVSKKKEKERQRDGMYSGVASVHAK
jgi:hypothetical protein